MLKVKFIEGHMIKNNKKNYFLVLFTAIALCAAILAYFQLQGPQRPIPLSVHTIYGDFLVSDPVLIDLMGSPAMQRMKGVRQYGTVDYVIKQPKEYTRYEHSVGVWALLNIFGASLEEQIAGLLHDVSHTVFSHVGDVVFHNKSAENSYQDNIHEWYLKQQKIDQLLAKHNIALESILHKSGKHRMLEQDLPEVCADRFEYNLQAGILTGMLNHEEIKAIIKDARFENGRWIFVTPQSAKKLAMVSLYNSEHVWGGPFAYFINKWTADALIEALRINLISTDDIHFSTDDAIWGKLWISNDPVIDKNLNKLISYKNLIKVTKPQDSDTVIKTKFRGIDPWVKINNEYKRLSEIDLDYKQEFQRVKTIVSTGWGVKLKDPLAESNLHDQPVS